MSSIVHAQHYVAAWGDDNAAGTFEEPWAKEGGGATGIYLRELRPILKIIESLHSWNLKLEQEAAKGGTQLSKALTAAYGETLKVS